MSPPGKGVYGPFLIPCNNTARFEECQAKSQLHRNWILAHGLLLLSPSLYRQHQKQIVMPLFPPF
jgi:hypothetical protein